MNKGKVKGLKRIINATKYSISGFKDTFKTEEAFRQEIYLSVILLPLSFFIAKSAIEWVLLVGSLLLLLCVEIINSAIEAVVDRIGTEQHELSGKAKDAGSAAVSLAIINVTICWLAIILF